MNANYGVEEIQKEKKSLGLDLTHMKERADLYAKAQALQVAMYALAVATTAHEGQEPDENFKLPESWKEQKYVKHNLLEMSDIDLMIFAGAYIAAEIERRKDLDRPHHHAATTTSRLSMDDTTNKPSSDTVTPDTVKVCTSPEDLLGELRHIFKEVEGNLISVLDAAKGVEDIVDAYWGVKHTLASRHIGCIYDDYITDVISYDTALENLQAAIIPQQEVPENLDPFIILTKGIFTKVLNGAMMYVTGVDKLRNLRTPEPYAAKVLDLFMESAVAFTTRTGDKPTEEALHKEIDTIFSKVEAAEPTLQEQVSKIFKMVHDKRLDYDEGLQWLVKWHTDNVDGDDSLNSKEVADTITDIYKRFANPHTRPKKRIDFYQALTEIKDFFTPIADAVINATAITPGILLERMMIDALSKLESREWGFPDALVALLKLWGGDTPLLFNRLIGVLTNYKFNEGSPNVVPPAATAIQEAIGYIHQVYPPQQRKNKPTGNFISVATARKNMKSQILDVFRASAGEGIVTETGLLLLNGIYSKYADLPIEFDTQFISIYFKEFNKDYSVPHTKAPTFADAVNRINIISQ